MAALNISISAEKLFNLGPLPVTNSMLTSVIASAVLIGLAVAIRTSLEKTNHPTGLQNFGEFLVEGLGNLVESITHSKVKADQLFPVVATFFLFILTNNWLGLLPGSGSIGFREEGVFVPFFRSGTADLNMTLALGLMSVLAIQFFGVKYQHLAYFKKFINFSNPIHFFIGILEIVSEISRVISFAFRLFGNVFAGEVLLLVISTLTKVVAPMPFYGMEIFVGFIQALVFTMLSVVLMNMATLGHGDNH